MCLLLREALTVGRISFHKDFHSNEMSDDEARRRVVDEMMNVSLSQSLHSFASDACSLLVQYCVVTEPPKTTFGKVCTTFKLCAPHLITVCPCNLTVTKNVHGQVIWPTRRCRHRSPTGDDRLLQVLPRPQVPLLPPRRLHDAAGLYQPPTAADKPWLSTP